MERYDFKSSLLKIENKNGGYISYKDFIKEVIKVKTEKIENNICIKCKKNKTCNPHNNYGVIAVSCIKFIERKK